ncbi:MAG: DUF559 domain-containing protein [Chlorobi bacterium]|nr:DUF559 domain-containing protein [Chlorobiota bacterium]
MQKAGPENNWHYNDKLRPLAKALRANMTKAEACLWKYVLRAGKTMGYSFTRQRPVLSYIADFMCKELCLVIEVDGITHQDEEVVKRDQLKQQDLEEAGFHVLRVTDEEVLNRIDLVANEIESFIKMIKDN